MAILECNCKHAAQDKLHGQGRRVHNECKVNDKQKAQRCTVCGKTRAA